MNKITLLFITCFAILSPIKPLIVVSLIMIIFDFMTGVWKNVKKGEEFQSSKMSNTISKTVLYNIAIISAFLLEIYIIPFLPVSKIVAGFLVTTEFQSLIENIGEITGIDIWGNIKKYFVKKSDNIA